MDSGASHSDGGCMSTLSALKVFLPHYTSTCANGDTEPESANGHRTGCLWTKNLAILREQNQHCSRPPAALFTHHEVRWDYNSWWQYCSSVRVLQLRRLEVSCRINIHGVVVCLRCQIFSSWDSAKSWKIMRMPRFWLGTRPARSNQLFRAKSDQQPLYFNARCF